MTQLTGFKKDAIGSYIEKDPQSVLDYTIDWTDWLINNDALSTMTWTISTISGDASPLAKTSDLIDLSTNKTTIYVSGGTANNNYRVTCRITTDAGLTEERYFRIFVRDRSL